MGTARSWISGLMPGHLADVVAIRPLQGVTGRPDARFRDDDLASQRSSSPGRGEIVARSQPVHRIDIGALVIGRPLVIR